jgi:DNA-directed RNA polymerase subunit beta
MEIRETKLGIEQITREIPEIQEKELENLDSSGVAKLGSWIQEGDILVGKITPINKKGQSPYQKLLYTILEKQFLPIRDSSLRAPKGIKAKVIGIQTFKNENSGSNIKAKVKTKSNQLSKKLDSLTKSKKLISNNLNHFIKVCPLLPRGKEAMPSFAKIKKVNLIKKISLISKLTNPLELKTLSRTEKVMKNVKNFSLKRIRSQLFFNSKGLLYKFNNKTNLEMNPDLQKVISSDFFNIQANNKETKNLFDKKNSFIYAMNQVKPSKDNVDNVFSILQPQWGSNYQTQTKLAKIYFIKKLQGYALAQKKKKTNDFLSSAKAKKQSICLDLSNEGKYEKLKSTKLKGSNINQLICCEEKTSADKTTKLSKGLTFIKKFSLPIKKNTRLRELYFKKKNKKKALNKLFVSLSSIHIYLAEKRKVQIGDKMAGRHGNKGIISQILPREDMPYLPDGTPLDMILNPLGVPSRMNVGQIYECLLGFAGKYLGENFKVFPFDEIYGPEASRSFVYSKLYEARVKTGFDWLYNPINPGKIRLYDGRTGESFDQAITVGDSYILRLVHMVDDKIHARSTGPYSLVTQQPLRGRSKQGGQRLGEMEVWALEGYGAAFTLLEMLTIKSDDMTGRMTLWSNLILNKDISIGTPESFKVLVCELQALCLDIGLFRSNPENKVSLNEIDSLMNLQ